MICTYNVCEVVVGGGDGELVVVCVYVCVRACMSVYVLVHMCVHEAREQLGKREKKKRKLTWKKVPTMDSNLYPHACGLTVLSPALRPGAHWR